MVQARRLPYPYAEARLLAIVRDGLKNIGAPLAYRLPLMRSRPVPQGNSAHWWKAHESSYHGVLPVRSGYQLVAHQQCPP